MKDLHTLPDLTEHALGGLQALKDGGVLAVHGQKLAVQAPGLFHYKRSARDQRLFICKQHALTAVKRREHCIKAGYAYHRAQRVVRPAGAEHARSSILAKEPFDVL